MDSLQDAFKALERELFDAVQRSNTENNLPVSESSRLYTKTDEALNNFLTVYANTDDISLKEKFSARLIKDLTGLIGNSQQLPKITQIHLFIEVKNICRAVKHEGRFPTKLINKVADSYDELGKLYEQESTATRDGKQTDYEHDMAEKFSKRALEIRRL